MGAEVDQPEVEVLLDGFSYGEGLRWHDGALFFSDMVGGSVWRVTDDGLATVVSSAVAGPSGLGFDADGALLVVGRTRGLLQRVDPNRSAGEDGEAEAVADLAAAGSRLANDLVSDGSGLAYVGGLGRPYQAGDEHRPWAQDAPGTLHLIDLRGSAPTITRVAEGLACPNGMVITPDRRTLIVAETFGRRLSAFDRRPDGSLTNRRVMATYGDGQPDGLALDAQGGVWAGLPYANRFVRVDQHGTLTDQIDVPGEWAVACALGGEDRRTLFMAVCTTTMDDLQAGRSSGRILTAKVDLPGAGWP